MSDQSNRNSGGKYAYHRSWKLVGGDGAGRWFNGIGAIQQHSFSDLNLYPRSSRRRQLYLAVDN